MWFGAVVGQQPIALFLNTANIALQAVLQAAQQIPSSDAAMKS
jgi:hypothetical protein